MKIFNVFTLSLALFSLQSTHAMLGSQLDHSYHAVGSIREKGIDPAFCTATLIAPDWIMTAEHCRYGGNDEEGSFMYKASQMEFLIGADSAKPIHKVALKKWVHGGKYTAFEDGGRRTVEIDVLFAQLSSPVTVAGKIKINPISLKLSPDLRSRSGVTYEIVGYGVSDKDINESKRQKGPYNVTTTQGNAILNIFKSEAAFTNYLKLAHPGEEENPDRHIGRGELTKGYQVHAWDSRGRENGKFTAKPKSGWTSSCNGDSGGPLLQFEAGKMVVVGVISGGFTGETEGCVRLGSRISVMGAKTIDAVKKNNVPFIP